VAVGAEVIWKTYVRIDALMIKIVEVLSKGITVVRLENGQRPAFRQLAMQGLQRDRKVVSRQVFEQIAGECEIDGAVIEEIQVGDAAYLVLDARGQVGREGLPRIDRNAA